MATTDRPYFITRDALIPLEKCPYTGLWYLSWEHREMVPDHWFPVGFRCKYTPGRGSGGWVTVFAHLEGFVRRQQSQARYAWTYGASAYGTITSPGNVGARRFHNDIKFEWSELVKWGLVYQGDPKDYDFGPTKGEPMRTTTTVVLGYLSGVPNDKTVYDSQAAAEDALAQWHKDRLKTAEGQRDALMEHANNLLRHQGAPNLVPGLRDALSELNELVADIMVVNEASG